MGGGIFHRMKVSRLKREALTGENRERPVRALAEMLSGEERIQTLIELAEKGSHEAVDLLGRGPANELVIDALCRLMGRSREFMGGTYFSLSLYGRAMNAMHRLDYDITHPKFVATLLALACDNHGGSWDAFKLLTLSKDPAVLDTVVIPELQRRVLIAPLTYAGFARPDAEYYLKLLGSEDLRLRRGARVAAVLREIEEATLRRRIEALPQVLNTALTAEQYDDVRNMAWELENLTTLGVVRAAEALEKFKSAPARRVQRARYRQAEYHDGGETFSHAQLDGYDVVSTEELGQRPAS